MSQRNYAYIRVSTKEQNIDRQLESIKNLDIDKRDIYIDKQSGKNFDRPEYQALKRSIREGDTLFIKSLDRFGRNKQEILKEWQWLIDNQINVVVIDMPILDTRKYKELDGVGELVTTLVLQILSWLSEEERKNIKQRQQEGIKVAKQNGVQFGRPRIEITDKFNQVYKEWKRGNITAIKAMSETEMSRSTFYRRVKEIENY